MRRLFSKVGLDDFGVADHGLRVAVGDLAPGHEYRDALGEFHHRAHHVLDHDDGDAAMARASSSFLMSTWVRPPDIACACPARPTCPRMRSASTTTGPGASFSCLRAA